MRACVRACVCVCVCGRNEPEVCTMLAYPHMSSFHVMPVLTHKHTHTRILKPFDDSEPTGLKVDIADLLCLPLLVTVLCSELQYVVFPLS